MVFSARIPVVVVVAVLVLDASPDCQAFTMRESRPLSLLIRNLRYTTSPECVRQLFEQFGKVFDLSVDVL